MRIEAAAGFVTLVWPPSGISLAAVLLVGFRIWPGIAAGALAVNLWAGASVPTAAVIAASNTAEAVLGAWLFLRATNGRTRLEALRDAAAFVLLAASAPTLLAAVVGSTALLVGGALAADEFWLVFRTRWLGDALSVLTVCPAILVLVDIARNRRHAAFHARSLEAVALAVVLLVDASVVFGSNAPGGPVDVRRAYLLFPPVVWAALRFGVHGGAGAVIAVKAIALAATIYGLGPFGSVALTERLDQLQYFLAVLATTSLLLGAGSVERRESERALREAKESLEDRVRERTAALEEAQKIASIGSWTWIVGEDRIEWSDELCRIFGLSPGNNPRTYDAFFAMLPADERPRLRGAVESALRDRRSYEVEHRIVRSDGEIRTLLSRGEILCDDGEHVRKLSGTGQDITRAKEVEEALRQTIRQKELLLKEIHHRVKNTFQLVTSLLRVQAVRVDRIAPEELLRETYSRIRSIALLYDRLYRSDDPTSVQMEAHLDAVVREVASAYLGTDNRVTLDVDIAGVRLSIDKAIHCSLIVIELVSNSMKHAFPGGRRGTVRVKMRRDGDWMALECSDDGIGLPEGVGPTTVDSLGLPLVWGLARQLESDVELSRAGGTRFRFRFRDAPMRPAVPSGDELGAATPAAP